MSLGKRISRRSQKKPLFYGWIMVAVMTAVGSLSMALGTLNFGLFIRPMGDELGIGRGVFGLAQTARMTAAAVTSPIVGRLIDQIGSRLLVPLAAFITGAALMAVANISQGWQLVMLFALMGIIGIGGPSNLTTTVPIAKWFVRQRGRAMAIVTAGPFVGGILFVPLTQLLIDALGWRSAWVALAIIGAGLILPLGLIFIRHEPTDMGLQPDGDGPDPPPNPHNAVAKHLSNSYLEKNQEVSWTLREALHSSTFWRLAAVFSLVMLSISTVGLHRIPNFVDQGLDPGLVAIATAMDAAAGGVSTVAMGLLTERVPSRFMGSIAFTFLAVAIYFTIIGDTVLLMFVSFTLFGAGIGGLMLLNSFLWADYFGRLHLGSIRGIVMPITMFFSALGAPLAGFIRDTTGTYDNIWWLSVVIMLIATALLASTGRPIKTHGFVQPSKSL